MAKAVYILENSQSVGPYTEQDVEELVRRGRIQTVTPCWYKSLPDWTPAGTIFPRFFQRYPSRPAVRNSAEPPPSRTERGMAPTVPSPAARPSGAGVPAPLRRTGEPMLADGELVAGRYRVVRFIGLGGMGEVYEVEDQELHARVALKTIRPEIAQDEAMIGRFKREIILARKVTHPHVCRIFDLGFHRPADPVPPGFTGDIHFLTMELLPGETLADFLQHRKRLAVEEALPIVRQMAEGLAAAHKAGVVHRDFKPGNVILVPSPEPGGEARAVITDFGMARGSALDDGFGASLTGGGLVGTPATMAPEQVEGGPITAGVDIYALGVVLFRLVTGVFPFTGDTGLAVAVKRLHHPPPRPGSIVADLDPRWEAVILRCLERDPERRFASAREVLAALDTPEKTRPLPPPGDERIPEALPVRSAWKRRILAGGGIALAILAVLAVGWGLRNMKNPPGGNGATGEAGTQWTPVAVQRRAVAVFGFKNLSGRADLAWLSVALAEMLNTELGAGGKVRIVPTENIARLKIELALPDSAGFSVETLSRIRRNLGSDLVVLGAYLAQPGPAGTRIRVDLHLQDTRTGDDVLTLTEGGAESDLSALISRIGLRLREKLSLGPLSTSDAQGVRASLPGNPDAGRLYAEGLIRLRLFDAMGARHLLEGAVTADPSFAPAQRALADALQALGYDALAAAAARKAIESAGKLPREERLLIEARYQESVQSWDKAAEIYRSLWTFFPDDLEYGLRLAQAQISGERAAPALQTLAALRRLPQPLRDDPRIDLIEAAATEGLSDYKRQQSAAARAAAKGTALGARLLVANARLIEGSAWRELGQPAKALAAASESKRILAAAGDQSGAARAIHMTAILLFDQGDLDGALRMFEETLAIFSHIGNRYRTATSKGNMALVLKARGELDRARQLYEECLALLQELGDRTGVATSLNNIANVYYAQGDLAAAEERFEKALAVYREIGNKSGVALELNNLGTLHLDGGDFSGAVRRYEQSLAMRREIGDKAGEAGTLANLGSALECCGDLTAASRRYQESLSICQAAGNRSDTATALFGLGEIAMARGDLAAARELHEKGLALRLAIGEQGDAAYSRLALGQLALEESRLPEAERLTREASGEFGREHAADGSAMADCLLARVLLARQQPREARQALAPSAAWRRRSKIIRSRLFMDITAAEVEAAAGAALSAYSALLDCQARAEKTGLLPARYEASLALARIELGSGRAAAGNARLAGLNREATARGFGLVARKAAALRQGPPATGKAGPDGL